MFQMGSPDDEPGHGERPYDETRHPVWLTRPFYLSKHETTVGQFRRFVEKQNYRTDGEKNGGGHAHDAEAVWNHRPGVSWLKPGYAGPFKLEDAHPVVHVSHADAKAFCAWLNGGMEKGDETAQGIARYDLPTEAQWEWACRAGSGARFWWGAEEDRTGKVINAGDQKLKEVHPKWPRSIMAMNDGHAFAAPVGSYRANAFGLHDMLGNVWEFCSTHYGPYPRGLDVDPLDLDPKRGFAVRGGGWSNEPVDARCATRNADPPHFCHSNLGFRVALQLPPRNLSRVVEQGHMPLRVHVVETYETDIEKRWWMAGEAETKNLPPSPSASVPNRRVCRATSTLNFDRKMGDRTREVKAVIFNPVPGPPMGERTRLSFRYYLDGTDSIKVQIYTLSRGYHRYLMLTGLVQGKWQTATVDMTDARRPEGGGGPLSLDERIDDIQFYIAPDADLFIDDILLYEAAPEDEMRPFPRRVIFTGWFDTGVQGKEWPGDFEIVLHKKPLTWDAARSVLNPKTEKPWVRVNLRGHRRLSAQTSVRFRYKITGGDAIQVVLADSTKSTRFEKSLKVPASGKWAEGTVAFDIGSAEKADAVLADEVQFLVDRGAELHVDDVLIFEPGTHDGEKGNQP
jgi:formylglycine-generating enzyme required for sulfatase activity